MYFKWDSCTRQYIANFRNSDKIYLESYGKFQQQTISDVVVCMNNNESSYSKITESTREQSFATENLPNKKQYYHVL